MTWEQPYLETCCRSALHRLFLAGGSGRPDTSLDTGCLRRLVSLGCAREQPALGFVITEIGLARHRRDVLGS
jgi:hypothetical protein